jgi:hypothetical protein
MLMRAGFPIPITPGIITELRSISQLSLGNPGAIAAQSGVVFERRPRDRIMAMTKPRKPPKLINGVGHPAADFLDHEVVDLAYLLITGSEARQYPEHRCWKSESRWLKSSLLASPIY